MSGKGIRTAQVVGVAALLLFVDAPIASAQDDRDVPSGLTRSARSQNFEMHWAPRGRNRFTVTNARRVLAAGERALRHFVTVVGTQRPKRDDDRRVDIYMNAAQSSDAQAGSDGSREGYPSSGYIEVKPDVTDDFGDVAHELFHVIQFAYGLSDERVPWWFAEGTASWASAYLYGARTSDATFETPVNLGMRCNGNECPGDGGYGWWKLWQSLAEGHGPAIVSDVLRRSDAYLRSNRRVDPTFRALGDALAARGASFPLAFQAFLEQHATGRWQHPLLDRQDSIVERDGLPGEENVNVLQNGAASSTLTQRALSGRFVRFTEAENTGCAPSTITFTVTPPPGLVTHPSVLVSTAGAEQVVKLAPAGGSFTASVPWQRCDSDAYVLITNPDPLRPGSFTVQAARS